jgi:hypothetical protein
MNKAKDERVFRCQHACLHQPRFTVPKPEAMTEEQGEIRDTILANRPGTGLTGPFGCRFPRLLARWKKLGKAVHYGTSLSRRESELVALLTGSNCRCGTEIDVSRQGLP